MGWRELQAWLGAMNRQCTPPQRSPDSWAGYDRDPEYQELRRQRDAQRAALYR